ncbi:unnamed protein product [Parascedosporium putredinis]|uniref:F-box domain-containing protein n=1 Tax=Parascedosporium putredinis TaxID=1442378 RepID=A0A9P1HAZ1_9PEZI|nr:unnamed protein product [Parascedosporium putredinis]CAI8002227.1 unnamed protein product [Parascedosporium putredinis]
MALRSPLQAPRRPHRHRLLLWRRTLRPHLQRNPRREGTKAPATPATHAAHGNDDYVQTQAFDELFGEGQGKDALAAGQSAADGEKTLESALDHFEAAVMREAQGNLGDSLNLYRKAFRPPPAALPPNPSATSSPAFKPSASPQPPEVEGTPAAPCPIANLPEELLAHILRDVAVLDVADFARLSRVCKRFAYLVATEDRIWRRVCLGPEFGFAGMHYRFRTDLYGKTLPPGAGDEDDDQDQDQDRVEGSGPDVVATPRANHVSPPPLFYASSWKTMWRTRPRIRFNGAYIATANYIRSGLANVNYISWNSPVHIVTYYRYLRFFRDGTVISLLTTTEPADVVPYLTKDLVETHRGGAAPTCPPSSSKRPSPAAGSSSPRLLLILLATPAAPAPVPDENPEGDLVVETEGVVGEKYVYRLDLSLRSAGKPASRNNKLVWRGFHSYNKLTDDWAIFELKNDKPFFFSRVRSYGLGA